MSANKWEQPGNPPPPLFTGKKEKDLVKQINDEVIERVIGQTIIYYPISIENTNFNPNNEPIPRPTIALSISSLNS